MACISISFHIDHISFGSFSVSTSNHAFSWRSLRKLALWKFFLWRVSIIIVPAHTCWTLDMGTSFHSSEHAVGTEHCVQGSWSHTTLVMNGQSLAVPFGPISRKQSAWEKIGLCVGLLAYWDCFGDHYFVDYCIFFPRGPSICPHSLYIVIPISNYYD